MNIVFDILIFIMGTVFGSFFTLAVYRIPLGIDITHKRSFCPNCNHRLEFKDLIPVWSYVFLRGKCRYCGEKVRIRYLILEVLSGTVFLITYLSFNMNFPFLKLDKIIDFVGFVLFYVTVVIIAGIDKERIKLQKSVIIFGIISNCLYMLYLYISGALGIDIYRYEMYLIIMVMLFILDTISLRVKGKSIYLVQILMFIDYILMYLPFDAFWITAILSIAIVAFYYCFEKIKFSKNKASNIEKQESKIPVLFCISIAAVTTVIINNFYIFWR